MNLLITGAWQGAKEHIAELEKMGHQVQFLQYEKDELPCDYNWVEGVICNGLFLTHPIESFVNLKYIQLTSAGFDRVPLDYVEEHRIEIRNARGVYSAPMAEFAIAGVLSLYKKLREFDKNQQEHKWEKLRDLKELSGQRVCILGCGSVGTECAKRFKAFDCEIVGINTNGRAVEYFDKVFKMTDIKEAISDTDIVVLTLPLTDDTYHIMNAEMFEAMKHGAILVNIARGALIDTDAMMDALGNKLYGAVLDVFEEEPLNESCPLWNMKNVIITPHNSFVGDGNNNRLSNVITENLGGCLDE